MNREVNLKQKQKKKCPLERAGFENLQEHSNQKRKITKNKNGLKRKPKRHSPETGTTERGTTMLCVTKFLLLPLRRKPMKKNKLNFEN